MTRSLAIAVALLSACAHFPAPEASPTCTTDRAELREICTEYARAIRQSIVLRVMPDGSNPWGSPNSPYSEMRSGQRPACEITIQEQHVPLILETRAPLPHESLHCLLWRANGDPDREHASPWWPQ